MKYQGQGRLSVLGKGWCEGGTILRGVRVQFGLRLGWALAFLFTSAITAFAQAVSPQEVPVTLVSDRIVHEGEYVFLMTSYPVTVVDDQSKQRIAPANSYLRCRSAPMDKNKNLLPLSDCEMLFQSLGEKDNPTYTCNLSGEKLSIRWRDRLFWDQLVNAGETWEAAVGSFAIGSTAALFTTRHTLIAVGTAAGFLLTGVGPLAKHHPAWFLPSKKWALPDNRALFFNFGKPALTVKNLKCVGDNGCAAPPGRAP